VFGQLNLFGGRYEGQHRRLRFTVSVAGRRGPATTNLALAVARARAIAAEGQRAVITADDGTAATVQLDERGFVVTAPQSTPWNNQCRRLLAEHG
jgi:hypothetical protein